MSATEKWTNGTINYIVGRMRVDLLWSIWDINIISGYYGYKVVELIQHPRMVNGGFSS